MPSARLISSKSRTITAGTREKTNGDGGGQPVTAMVEPVAICVAERLDDLDGRQRPVAADGVKHADHAIPLEVGYAGAARRDGYFVDAEDDAPAHGIAAIGRAMCHEADHAGGRPPLVGKIKLEPSGFCTSSMPSRARRSPGVT